MKKVLLAGATGYLGKHIAAELLKQGYATKVLVRNRRKFESAQIQGAEIIEAEVTDTSTFGDCFADVEAVISTVGITRQKDGLTYMDVDYQANKNLLDAAKEQGVSKFVYVSVLHGSKLMNVAICRAKERFVDELKSSGLDYCVIRPGGFFSDMAEFYSMAKKGKIFLFGNGQLKSNPISGADLAEVCVESFEKTAKEIEIGGPEVLTQEEIAQVAFDALGKKAKIIFLPDWIRVLALKLGRVFMNKYQYGPFEFFMTVMAMDMVAPTYGERTLYNFYKSIGTKP